MRPLRGICSARFGIFSTSTTLLLVFLPSIATGTSSRTTQTSCTLCDNGQYPFDEAARARVSEGMVLNCSQLYSIAPTLTDDEDCMGIQSIGRTTCQCNPEEKIPCTLCSDGSPLPEPDGEIYAGTTCADLEERAANDFASNCDAWQSTAGVYCSCPSNVDMEANRCNICPGEPLPDPFKMVFFENGGSKTCLELEVDINRSQGKCGQYQRLYAERCGCFDSGDAPDATKNIGDDTDVRSGAYRYMCTAYKPALLATTVLIVYIA